MSYVEALFGPLNGLRLVRQQESQPPEETTLELPEGELQCAICWRQYVYPYTLSTCAHTFCRVCLEGVLARRPGATCPLCRADFQRSSAIFNRPLQQLFDIAGEVVGEDDHPTWPRHPTLATLPEEAFIAAAVTGNFAVVAQSLESGTDVHAGDEEALLEASDRGHLDIVRLLVENGADIHVELGLEGDDMPLMYACMHGHVEVARFLLDNGADIHASFSGEDDGPLFLACESDFVVLARFLLDRGADANATCYYYNNDYEDEGEESVLSMVARNGSFDILNLLLHRGARPDEHALICAAGAGAAQCVFSIVQAGANVQGRGTDLDVVHAGTSVWEHELLPPVFQEEDSRDSVALQIAAKNNHVPVVEMLLYLGANVHGIGMGGIKDNALLVACEGGHLEVVRLLLNSGAVPDAGGTEGFALRSAARKGHIEVVRLLLDRGAQPVGLLDAVTGNQVAVARLLLERGANIHWEDEAVRTAINNRSTEMLRLLQEHGAVRRTKRQR